MEFGQFGAFFKHITQFFPCMSAIHNLDPFDIWCIFRKFFNKTWDIAGSPKCRSNIHKENIEKGVRGKMVRRDGPGRERREE